MDNGTPNRLCNVEPVNKYGLATTSDMLDLVVTV